MKHKKRIIILGAGIAGLSAAYHLQKRGNSCIVFEKEPLVGGLCRSKEISGFTFDYDGHLLHFKQNYAFSLISDCLGVRLAKHKRNAWIYSFNGIYSRYPFQANLYGLPPNIVKECLFGFIKARHSDPCFCRGKNPNSTFLDWINQTFGKAIAKYFMIPYNTKFWTLPPKDLTCEWLDGFVSVPSLEQLIAGTVKENYERIGYNAHFYYPKKGGISQLPEAFKNHIKNIYTAMPVIEINPKQKEIKLGSGEKIKFDYLIYTLPLPEALYLIPGLPSGVVSSLKKLRWNSIFNLNLGIERKDCSQRHWVYFPQKGLPFFRVGFYHNFSSLLVPWNKSSLYVEVSYSKNLPLDKKNIISRIRQGLVNIGLLKKKDKISICDVNDIKYGYPIYDFNYRIARKNIIDYLKAYNIMPCGRVGSWRYFSIEDAMMDGKRAAENYD